MKEDIDSDSPKAQKMVRVSEATLKIIHQHGLESLTHSRLARSAGVSRPWIYAYVGKTKEDLVKLAVNHFGHVYAKVDRPSHVVDEKTWIESQIHGLKMSLIQVIEYPWLMPVYFRYRGTENSLGRAIVENEKIYLRKQATELEKALKLNPKDARVVSELVTAFKLGLQYRWAVTSLSKDIDAEYVLKLGRLWLKRAIQR